MLNFESVARIQKVFENKKASQFENKKSFKVLKQEKLWKFVTKCVKSQKALRF